MRSLFVVGDGKQSIFSFQGAKPLEFDRMQSSLRKRIGENGGEFRNISLDLSFRSTAAVLKAVDDVFALPEARDGLIFSEGDISHQAYRQGMAGRVELLPLAEVKNEDDGSAWQSEKSTTKSQSPETLSANYIADMIADWLKSGRKIISQDRQVQAGDIMILVQRRGRFAGEMLRSLKRRNIPVTGSDRMTLTDHIAVQDCMVLGEFLLLPQDDLSLATLLKSPFCGLNDDDLFELAYNRKHETIWQRLKYNPKFIQSYEFLSDILGKT
ncbi:MAG: 3'-5' exonuclease, partial [Pseudomonadota bacterium]